MQILNLFNSDSLEVRFEKIARNLVKAKTQDFNINPEGKSLIHYACLFDNLNLFLDCLNNGQTLNLKDQHEQTALEMAFAGISMTILDYLISTKKINDISDLKAKYDEPIWWKGFNSGIVSNFEKEFIPYNNSSDGYYRNKSVYKFSDQELTNYIKLLVDNGVDLNQIGGVIGTTLAYNLMSKYNHRLLYVLINTGKVDVNIPCRKDSQMTLAHWCGLMEDHRAAAFLESNNYVTKAYTAILSRCDYTLVDENNHNVPASMCYRGHRFALDLLIKAQAVVLTQQDNLWINRQAIRKNALTNAEILTNFGDAVFFEVAEVSHGVFDLKGPALITGIDDMEIKAKKVASIKEISSWNKVKVNSPIIYIK